MIEKTVREIYSLLLNSEYQRIESLTKGIRLNAQEIEDSVSAYGRTLTHYPEKIELDIIEIAESDPKAWSVVAPIYTVEEGLSDLSIELTLIQKGTDEFKVEFDDIHVR